MQPNILFRGLRCCNATIVLGLRALQPNTPFFLKAADPLQMQWSLAECKAAKGTSRFVRPKVEAGTFACLLSIKGCRASKQVHAQANEHVRSSEVNAIQTPLHPLLSLRLIVGRRQDYAKSTITVEVRDYTDFN